MHMTTTTAAANLTAARATQLAEAARWNTRSAQAFAVGDTARARIATAIARQAFRNAANIECDLIAMRVTL